MFPLRRRLWNFRSAGSSGRPPEGLWPFGFGPHAATLSRHPPAGRVNDSLMLFRDAPA
jgi:hypothetical protein